MEDVKKQRRNSIPLFELGYGRLKFSFRRVRLHLTKYVGRNNAIKTERTQIHFLSDVLFCRLVVGSGVKVSFANGARWDTNSTNFLSEKKECKQSCW